MNLFSRFINHDKSIAPLTSFRVLFGFMMTVSLVRFAVYGWIEDLYVNPSYYFTYLGFDWVQPLGLIGMYILFIMMFFSALGIMLGWYYRWSSILFFLCFTYVELIDKTNYLNHYYFVSLMAFLLILVPAHRSFSLDVLWRNVKTVKSVPAWSVNVFILQLTIVYLYAGIAKLNPYWLTEAMPLKLWLPTKTNTPLIGFLFNYDWTPFFFSWFGAIYDLTIAFFLMWTPTRVLAYVAVAIFHVLTAILFQIGMFPFIMIASTLVFFSAEWHEKIQGYITSDRPISKKGVTAVNEQWNKVAKYGLILFFAVQLILPFRYVLYPGDLFWTEQGYRFSWRVMLNEKAGHTTFYITDDNGKREWVQNYTHLTPQQEKMMSTQPDMILQFAHYLGDYYSKKGFQNPAVYCDSKVTLNGRRSQVFVDTNVNLMNEDRGWQNKEWVTGFDKNRR